MSREILLVDDEDLFSNLMRDQLSRRGFSVTVASSGQEALEKIQKKLPDLILLDILMPGLNGIEVLKRLKADTRTKDIPVVVCSVSMRDKVSVQNLLDMGAKDFIPKPCGPDELAGKISAFMGK